MSREACVFALVLSVESFFSSSYDHCVWCLCWFLLPELLKVISLLDDNHQYTRLVFRIRIEVRSSEYSSHEFSEAFLCLKGRMTSDTYKCTRLKITILWLQDTKTIKRDCSVAGCLFACVQSGHNERLTRDSWWSDNTSVVSHVSWMTSVRLYKSWF